jgi:hypothetical protein
MRWLYSTPTPARSAISLAGASTPDVGKTAFAASSRESPGWPKPNWAPGC